MPINWIDYSIIILYLFVVVYIGWWAMKKVSNFDDYAVAGRGLPMSIFFAAIAATLCGGGATIGRVAFMHTTGIVVFAGLMGVVINQIFSGLYIAGRVHNIKNVYGLGDLCGLYYGHAGRLVSAVVSFLFCLGLFGVQILAMGAIMQTATGIDLIPAALISSAITLAYTCCGGMLGVTMTDAIQYVIIIVGISLCGWLAIDHAGGFDVMMANLQAAPAYVDNLKIFADWSPIQVVSLFFGFLFGEFCAPYFIQRYASTKSAKDSKAGVLIFSVHWIFFLATTAGIGLASMALQPDVKPDLAFTNLIRDVLPVGITGLVLAALLAAVMSSAAAFINTACVSYTRDIYNKFINPQATQAQMLRQSRLSLSGRLRPDALCLQTLALHHHSAPALRPALGQDFALRGRARHGHRRLELSAVERQSAGRTLRHSGQSGGHGHQLPGPLRHPPAHEKPPAPKRHVRPGTTVIRARSRNHSGDSHAGIHQDTDLYILCAEHRLRRLGLFRHHRLGPRSAQKLIFRASSALQGDGHDSERRHTIL